MDELKKNNSLVILIAICIGIVIICTMVLQSRKKEIVSEIPLEEGPSINIALPNDSALNIQEGRVYNGEGTVIFDTENYQEQQSLLWEKTVSQKEITEEYIKEFLNPIVNEFKEKTFSSFQTEDIHTIIAYNCLNGFAMKEERVGEIAKNLFGITDYALPIGIYEDLVVGKYENILFSTTNEKSEEEPTNVFTNYKIDGSAITVNYDYQFKKEGMEAISFGKTKVVLEYKNKRITVKSITYTPNEKITLPTFTNKEASEVKTYLEEAGFTIETEEKESEKSTGTLLEIKPEENLQKNGNVTIVTAKKTDKKND